MNGNPPRLEDILKTATDEDGKPLDVRIVDEVPLPEVIALTGSEAAAMRRILVQGKEHVDAIGGLALRRRRLMMEVDAIDKRNAELVDAAIDLQEELKERQTEILAAHNVTSGAWTFDADRLEFRKG